MKERFPHFGDVDTTWAGRVKPEDLTEQERRDIRSGILGYCEGHRVLYRKCALHSCLVPAIFEGALGRECKEWPSGPKEWSPRFPDGRAAK